MNIIARRSAFYHDLAVLLKAGLPIIRSLNTVKDGQQGHYKEVFSDVHKSISKGSSLSESMAEHKKVFDRLDVMLVQAGEMSGNLPECFTLLTNWYEFQNRLMRIIKKGLIIPLFVLHIAAFVIPLRELFLTDMTLAGYFFKVLKILAAFYIFVVFFVVGYKLIRKNRGLSKLLDIFILRVPMLGQGIRHLSISRYCRAFNMLYKAGVPITKSLTHATQQTGNTVISGLFEGGAISAAAGNTACDGFSSQLPSEYLNLWQIGEETGELEKMVDKIAELAGDKAELILTECAKWFPWIVYGIICIFLILQIFSGYAKIYSIRGLY
jgi:type II secretory pathway component PulF